MVQWAVARAGHDGWAVASGGHSSDTLTNQYLGADSIFPKELPADVNSSGICWVDTAELDGETNAKCYMGFPEVYGLRMHQLRSSRGTQ